MEAADNRYRERLRQIFEELRNKQEFLDLFRDQRAGYVEGYADALNEIMIKLKAIEIILQRIEEANNETKV